MTVKYLYDHEGDGDVLTGLGVVIKAAIRCEQKTDEDA